MDRVNAERAKIPGCPLLAVDEKLSLAASGHSKDMGDYNFLAHENPYTHTTPPDRITAQGYIWSAWAENVAGGQESPARAVTDWMNSPGHRANILNCSLCETGVGYYYQPNSDLKHYWTQVFAVPAGRACKPPPPPSTATFTPTFTPTPTNTATPTVTPTPTKTKRPPPMTGSRQYLPALYRPVAQPPAGPVVRNGDFEAGPDGSWLESSTIFGNGPGALIARDLPDSFQGLTGQFRPYSGAYVAWLGGRDNETSMLEQGITFPNASGYHLRFALYIASYEPDCTSDMLRVLFIRGAESTPLLTKALCNGIPYRNWAILDVDLDQIPSLRGQSGRLVFYVTTDGQDVSHVFIDDVMVYRKTEAE